MFVHKQQLEYQLSPACYFDPGYYERELERLFLPGWHLVATKADLPRSGDFCTLELLGRPLLVRNFDGRHHAFLNVCSHRHCLLTHEPRGNSERMRCQYHGWEYDATGRTGKIPDAGCFRPFDRENARLKQFRLEACGELLFVSLADEGPDLREFLGDFYDPVAERFAPPMRQVWTWEHEYECNWKLPVENTVESYHLPCIHTGVFAAAYPSEEAQQHDLDEHYTTLLYDLAENPSLTFWQGLSAKVLGAVRNNTYMHRLVHPHFVVTMSDVFVHAQVFLPLSPTRSRTIARAYSYFGTRRNPLAWIMGRLTAYQGAAGVHRVQLEDASIMADAQRGIESSAHRGCIGTREERVYVFQKFVRDRCGAGPREKDPGEDGVEQTDAAARAD